MKKSVWRVFIIFLLVCGTGCSSVLTYLGPLKSEMVDGDTSVGEFSHYTYDYHAIKNTIFLKKVPMCHQMQQKLRVMEKQRRGLYIALLEMPFFGLGLFDMLRSYAIVEESRKVIPLAKYKTGEVVQCGKKTAAGSEPLIIRNVDKGIEKKAVTNETGVLALNKIFPDVSGALELQIQVEAKPSFSFSYQYNADLH